VPLLETAVAACGELLINIELKDLPGEPGYEPSHPLAGLVAEFIVEWDLTRRVIVSSFDLLALEAVHAVEPAITTAWLTSAGYDQRDALSSVVTRGHQALHPHHADLTESLVEAAHRVGIAVNTWTVDEPDRIRAVAAAGVDGIITNRPDLAREALAA
jgi:glycerophosphoryl diester phosphodiesterase